MNHAPTPPPCPGTVLPWSLAALLLAGCCTHPRDTALKAPKALREALTFHASFDASPDADFGQGDRRLQFAPQWGQPRNVQPGLPPGGAVHLDPGAGKHGGALRFEHKIPQLVAYRAAGNLTYRDRDWGGSVSLWLRVSPDADLAPEYCDPIQITPRSWDDASFFTDFTQEKPRQFRLGAIADHTVWNPTKRDWDRIPLAEKPLVTVAQPPFSRDRWTHVAFTWDHYNTGQPTGVTRLYLDGQLQGEVPTHLQTFTWDPEKCLIMLGFAYTGWIDDLAVFNRALSAEEIGLLQRLPGGVSTLHR